MDDTALASLLGETAEAHHRAFAATDGADPDWPQWYASYLLDHGFDRFAEGSAVSAKSLTDSLIDVDRRHRSEAAPPPWEPYYAKHLLERLHGSTA